MNRIFENATLRATSLSNPGTTPFLDILKNHSSFLVTIFKHEIGKAMTKQIKDLDFNNYPQKSLIKIN